MEVPTFSMVTPLFRTRVEDLRKQLSLLLKAPRSKIEWLLVNDDPENAELDSFVRQELTSYPFVRYLTNSRNLNTFESYRRGFQAATGHYVGILDHDDQLDLQEFWAIEGLLGYDFIYSNEYKFEDNIPEKNLFLKPKFDAISSIFYFYTHHITFFRTDLVKLFIHLPTYQVFPSIFDIWLSGNFHLQAVGNRRTRFFHLEDASYGWRIHDESTARSIQTARPTQRGERLQYFEQSMRKKGEYGKFKIHKNYDYAIDAEFYSSMDYFSQINQLNEARVVGAMDWKEGLFRHPDCEVRWLNELSASSKERALDLLLKIPAKTALHLDECSPILVLDQAQYSIFGELTSFKRHLVGIPFLLEISSSEIKTKNLSGLYMKIKTSLITERVRVLFLKD